MLKSRRRVTRKMSIPIRASSIKQAQDMDMKASLDSVRHLATRFEEKFDSLDVLINNAGVFPPKQKFTQDGFEMQFGVNHLAHFLLTNLLLGCLEKNSPSRVPISRFHRCYTKKEKFVSESSRY